MKKKRTRVRGGDIEEPAQVEATTDEIQGGIPSSVTPEGFAAMTKQLGSQIAGEKAWIYPFPSGYPQYLFYHPNQYSRNPNQVIMFSNKDDLMSSLFYKKYQARLQYVPAPYAGFGIQVTRDWIGLPITPGKPFRIIFVDNNPDDADKWIFDAQNGDEYVQVINMLRGDDSFAASEAVLLTQATAEKLREQYLEEGYEMGSADQKAVDDAVIEAANEQDDSSDDSGFWGDVGSFCGGLAEAFL
jgi:hypothetical protein